MTQGVLPFKYEEEKKDFGTTAVAGILLYDDIKKLENDGGLRRIFKNLELRNAFGRSRQKLIRQWRNGKRNAFPSSSAIFRYLLLFHNADQEVLRQERQEYFT